MPTFFLIPLVMRIPTNNFIELRLDKYKSIFNIITFLVKFFNTETILRCSVNKFNSFWIVKTILKKIYLSLTFLRIFINYLRIYLVKLDEILVTDEMSKIVMFDLDDLFQHFVYLYRIFLSDCFCLVCVDCTLFLQFLT